MKNRTFQLGLLMAGTLAATAQAQTFSTIASEDFDSYATGPLGGLGTAPVGFWFSNWFSGGGGADANVVTPGLGSTVNACQTNFSNAGNFRSPKTGPWITTVADGFNFGGNDGTATIWVSFDARRAPGSTDQYGGLSLHTQFVGEKLFLGSPFQSNEWGIGPLGSVAGSSVDVATRLVYKIEYQAGDEICSLWVNPGVAHPTSTPDLTGTVPSHDWNEIRLQAGEPTDGNTGYLFDNILIECQDCDPDDITSDTSTLSIATGGTQNLTLNGGVANEGQLYFLLGSASGTAPGFPTGGGTLPLNVDAYFLFTLGSPAPILSNNFNVLNLDGAEFASFNLPVGVNPALVGSTINHAYVVFDLSLNILKVSTAEPVTLIS